ncbi:MAG: AAA family ATPase [Gammaproteobacteria bacterium]|nr:AAA family ATPase [Gammaproteobacteria bacterium]
MITVIANLKGGSGKSTVAFNLAIWLKMKGEVVVAYDLDPQQTLHDVALVRREDDIEPELLVSVADSNDICGTLNNHSCHVLVDVGAANMDAMKAAISIAHRVIVPVQPSQPDVWATQRFLKIINDACGDNNHPELVAFINRADTHHAVRESDEAEQALKMLEKFRVIPYRLCQRTSFRRTLSEGLSIFELSGKSKSAEEFDQLAHALYPDLIN